MSTPSLLSSVGLDVGLFDRTGLVFKTKLSQYVTSYSHTINRVGGFGTASIGITMPSKEALYLFESLLAGRIKVTVDAGRSIFEGSIDVVSINAGGDSESIGPLFDIGNRVSVTYAPLNVTYFPPTVGSTIRSLITEEFDSQAKYGIIEQMLSMGTSTDAGAVQSQATFLRDGAWPNRSGTISLSPGGGQQISLTIECVGLYTWFKTYVYNLYSSGTGTLDTKLKAIITAEVNNYISRDYSHIATNANLAPAGEYRDRFAWDIITDLISLGDDVTDDPRNFGVYDNAMCVYESIPTSISYSHRLSDPHQCVTDPQAGHVVIPPWLVRPGKFLVVPDFITTSIPDTSASLKKDPRVKFIESVAYTAPWTIDLSGGKMDSLSQLLAKITYSGGLF